MREEKILEARRLRALGWTAPAIGRELGVSDSTIRNWYLGGDCSDCGGPITYDSAAYQPTKRCIPCEILREKAEASPCGTRNKYANGCSCDDCLRANREYQRTLQGQAPPSHSYSGYVNYGCRCQKCRDGHLVYMRAKGYEHSKAWAKRVRGTEPPTHGTMTAYNKYNCRCDVCRDYASAYRRSHPRVRRAA